MEWDGRQPTTAPAPVAPRPALSVSDSDVLASGTPIAQLGSGSNGVVVLVACPGRAPDKVALKIVSHFWDAKAVSLLDCERTTLSYLPPHPNIIHVYSAFKAPIPTSMQAFLTQDMQSAVSADPSRTTQMFALEAHPTTLDAYRLLFPLPLPWFIMWRVAHELASVCVHLKAHRVLHGDLKFDNILVAVDGRPVLTDFGISRVFEEADTFSMQYCDPFPLLMNRLVNAPEVLLAFDACVRTARKRRRVGAPATGEAEELAAAAGKVPFAQQGVWSVGVVLYELACWYSPEPSYPDDGGGVRGVSYSLASVPPLPESGAPENLGFRQETPHGALRYAAIPGYPPAFAALVLAMIDPDPATRISAEDALQALLGLAPSYCGPQAHAPCTAGDSASLENVPLVVFRLPDGCVIKHRGPLHRVRGPGAPTQQGNTLSAVHANDIPVLLRHVSGECRLFSCEGGVHVSDLVNHWDAAAQISVSPAGGAAASQGARLSAADVKGFHVLLGASEVTHSSECVRALAGLVSSLAREPLRLTASDDDATAVPVLVLDLVPTDAVSIAAHTLLRQLDDADALCAQAGAPVLVSQAGRTLEAPVASSSSLSSELSSPEREPTELRRLLQCGRTTSPADGAEGFVDMREALFYRCCLALTGLCNEALRKACHETVAAAIGLLRNLTCTEDLETASMLLSERCIDATLSASFSKWAATLHGGQIQPEDRPDAVSSITRELSGASTQIQMQKHRMHLADPRLAEDALLTLSNLLRFSEHQVPDLPLQRIAQLVDSVLELFPQNAALHEPAMLLLKYLSGVSGTVAAESCVAGGALRALCAALAAFPSNADLVENALHVLCSLLVYDACRSAAACPYELAARAVVSVMGRPEHALSASVQALGATVLRNLACVVASPASPVSSVAPATSPALLSPALAVANAGAPAVLEAAMERLPDVPAVQENGRCALYNLLVIGARDGVAALKRVSQLEAALATAASFSSLADPSRDMPRVSLTSGAGMPGAGTGSGDSMEPHVVALHERGDIEHESTPSIPCRASTVRPTQPTRDGRRASGPELHAGGHLGMVFRGSDTAVTTDLDADVGLRRAAAPELALTIAQGSPTSEAASDASDSCTRIRSLCHSNWQFFTIVLLIMLLAAVIAVAVVGFVTH